MPVTNDKSLLAHSLKKYAIDFIEHSRSLAGYLSVFSDVKSNKSKKEDSAHVKFNFQPLNLIFNNSRTPEVSLKKSVFLKKFNVKPSRSRQNVKKSLNDIFNDLWELWKTNSVVDACKIPSICSYLFFVYLCMVFFN